MVQAEASNVKIEDFHEDVLAKAMRGNGLGKRELASRTGLSEKRIEGVLEGGLDEEVIGLSAKELKLDAEKLLVSAKKEWMPEVVTIPGLRQFNLPYGGMLVNAYAVWDESSRNVWLFDTGPEAKPILDFLESEKLLLDAILLTHTHPDHIACLEELKQKTGNPLVFVHALEAIEDANLIEEGFNQNLGNLKLRTLHTHGHSQGGMTYIIEGLEKPIAVVGDAMFAGSMGGGMVSYADALRTNREKIMTLPDETILCPGHGPMTTVGEEKRHNPFFPEF